MHNEISVGEQSGKTEVTVGLCVIFINDCTFANRKPRSFVKILIALYSFFQALRIAVQKM